MEIKNGTYVQVFYKSLLVQNLQKVLNNNFLRNCLFKINVPFEKDVQVFTYIYKSHTECRCPS